MRLVEIFGVEKPVIGVIHLDPLPGSPGMRRFEDVLRKAVLDGMILEEGGVDGLIVENFGDAPYVKDRVGYEVVACMTTIVKELTLSTSLPIGVNVLRNAVEAAIAVAYAGGARFVRANVWMGVYATGEGLLEGVAGRALRYRRAIGADEIRVFADFRVKHAAPLVARELEVEVKEYVERGGADVLIVTGAMTGQPPSVRYVERVKKAAEDFPVLVGSGVTAENVGEFLRVADGVIVASYFKAPDGRIELENVRRLVEAARRYR